eukprot:TRINITY_DN8357_c0_g1_i2.p1 TRINITY_DN8357_c0_g1~~TRINITY_DN8357_c0_g1_i2.p1  ORF type:complete len:169 (+),score=19.93 TRINITY_DN8357_c0_g1_i2:47-508(+)
MNTALVFCLIFTSFVASKEIFIQVGNGSRVFLPNTSYVDVGDVVTYFFPGVRHNVAIFPTDVLADCNPPDHLRACSWAGCSTSHPNFTNYTTNSPAANFSILIMPEDSGRTIHFLCVPHCSVMTGALFVSSATSLGGFFVTLVLALILPILYL